MTDLHDNIELAPVDDLAPYPNNPKEHPSEQVRKIADSIDEFGFTVPMVVDAEGNILAGHGRYAAVTEYLDLAEVPVIRRDDLTSEQARAFRIADNRVTESEWNVEKLGLELDDMQFDAVDPETLGFSEDEIDFYDEEIGMDENDPEELWDESGTAPDTNDDITAEHTVKVKLRDDTDLEAFEELVGQEVKPENKMTIWFPEAEELTGADKEVVGSDD